ncbi:MAG: ATP-binding cassette domain-containing protein [Anaerovoracaceae bacterium]|jgi:peptide/nickel transport system ATP-binding protein
MTEQTLHKRTEQLLQIENLTLTFHGLYGPVPAVRGVSLDVAPGEILALAGESGSGKTALCRCILRLHSAHAAVGRDSRIILRGRDVLPLSEEEMRSVRGAEAAIVFQDPMSSLDPLYPVGAQIVEPMLLHRNIGKEEAKRRAVELLRQVGIDRPELRAGQYPHQFSGGMRQRVAIAIALACSPHLLIADEPTTSLDAAVRNDITDLLMRIVKSRDGTETGMLFVTHDLRLARRIADRIAVMKDGVIIEEGPTQKIFDAPEKDYTRDLIRFAGFSAGRVHHHGRFHPKAESGKPRDNRLCAASAEAGELRHRPTAAAAESAGTAPGGQGKEVNEGKPRTPLIEVHDLVKNYRIDRKHAVRVLQHLNLNLMTGEILGIIGPSGSGKSTLAGCIMGIVKPDAGQIDLRRVRNAQMIFQDSAEALNPRMRIRDIIAEPLRIRNRFAAGADLRARVEEVMRQVNLDANLAERHPYDISGGQRQRAAIARALITEPDFIIADEPTSSLDVSTQYQIVHLLKKIRDERHLTMMLISHDFPLVAHISDRILTLSGGRLEETAVERQIRK